MDLLYVRLLPKCGSVQKYELLLPRVLEHLAFGWYTIEVIDADFLFPIGWGI